VRVVCWERQHAVWTLRGNAKTHITQANTALAVLLHFSVIAFVFTSMRSISGKLLDITEKFSLPVKILTCTLKVSVSNLGPDTENFRAPQPSW
jgi:hypothetical protein